MDNTTSSIPLASPECVNALGAVGDAIYVIGGKWKLRILIALSEGPKRFNELQRLVAGISARVLSNELKDLELNGFIVRTVHDHSIPMTVQYERTEYADTLKDVLHSLQAWGAMHQKKVRGKI